MRKLLKEQPETFAWLLLLICGLATGCASKSGEDKFSPTPQVNHVTVDARQPSAPGLTNIPSVSDTFVVGDLIILKFSGTDVPIPLYKGRVEDDGTITLPLIGVVKADGKTPKELLKEIHDRYVPRFYSRMTILFPAY